MDSPVDSASAEPYLFTDKNGEVLLSWITKTPQTHILKYSKFKNETWSEPITIASGSNWFVNWADYPLIVSDGKQHLISHFLDKSGKSTYSYDVKITTSSDQGKSWSTPVILHDDGKKAEHGFVSTVPYCENYFISWLDGRNSAVEDSEEHTDTHPGQMTLRGAVLDKSGKKINEWELDDRVCDCCQTGAGITSKGPVVIYRDRSDNETRDISIVRFANGKWTRPKTIFADNWKINGCPVNGPRIYAEGNNMAIAWFSAPGKKAQVNVVFSEDAGASFSKPVRIDEGNALGRVDIVLLDDKTAMVSWMEGSLIKAVKVYNTGQKDPPIIIAHSSDASSSGFPQMTKSGDQLFFAWTDSKEKTIKMARLSL